MDLSLWYPAIYMAVGYLAIMTAITHIKKDPSIGNFSWGGLVFLLSSYALGIHYAPISDAYFLAPLLAAFFIGNVITHWYNPNQEKPSFWKPGPHLFNLRCPCCLFDFIVAALLTILILYIAFYTDDKPLLVVTLVAFWFARLATHTYMRYKRGADPRFVAWLNQRGISGLLFSIVWVFVANGFMGTIMALPVIAICMSSVTTFSMLDYGALVLWIIGFVWEAVSDYQLYRFSQDLNNKDNVLATGLWRYSRHPNYFGELLMWWSIFLMAVTVPYGWLTAIAPIAETITLLFVTGVPLLEGVFANNLAYQDYKRRTSMLIPWFPRT